MSYRWIGLIFLLAGLGICAAGWYLKRRCGAAANYRNIAGFRLNGSGMAWTAGYLLQVFGASAALVGVLLLAV